MQQVCTHSGNVETSIHSSEIGIKCIGTGLIHYDKGYIQ